MSNYPVFYKKVVPLSNETHSELYIDKVEGFLHTKNVHNLYIAATEFIQAAREYPIVFAKDKNEKYFPVVLLGLDKDKNIYVDKKGKWKANYIPAYVRRYPFILAVADNDNFTVCIDESYSGFNTAKEGKALFNKKGENTEILITAVDFLKEFQMHVKITDSFCNTLSKLDVLEPMQANIQLASGGKQTLTGFMGVSREKLKALKPTKIAELLKSDQLELIFAHLASLSNINSLVNLNK